VGNPEIISEIPSKFPWLYEENVIYTYNETSLEKRNVR
jgi:hypothetical protein